jgi:hypothetical protein
MAPRILSMEISIKFKSIDTSTVSDNTSDLLQDTEFHQFIASREEAIQAVNKFFDGMQKIDIAIES